VGDGGGWREQDGRSTSSWTAAEANHLRRLAEAGESIPCRRPRRGAGDDLAPRVVAINRVSQSAL